uniref:condensin-2 complex subunit H2-like n=1 Tax=Styela clava TaxID=7725 RepID=UPI0019398B6C|nr:condensin-2 complex subunit H2-like [Styela clava]
MVLSEDLQKKYGFLLQPIKDITKNWEIDLTHVLEEYMEELEKMTFEFDNGKTVLNFAEASLLIQGTACVWSKKVEYLYVLVKQTLEMITNRQKEVPDENPNNSSSDKTIDPNFDDDEEKLLNLNDVAITSKREFTSNYDPITPIPITPTAMLENDNDERGRLILSENKNDSVCYTNDFWENRFIPFEKRMSVLDRDSGGFLDEIIVPSLEELEIAPMNIFSRSEEPVETNSVQEEMDNFGGIDESMDAGAAADDMDDAPPFVKNIEQEKTVIERMQLRERFLAKPVPIHETPVFPTILDPHEHCRIPCFAVKKYEKIRSYCIPASIRQSKTTRKRKINSPTVDKVEEISLFIMNKGYKKRRDIKYHDKCLEKFIAGETKERALLWKSIKLLAMTSDVDHSLGMPGKDVGPDAVFGEEEQLEPMNHDSTIHSDHFSSDLDDLIGDVIDNQGKGNHTAHETVSSPISYEDLVRHHVEMFYSAARRFKEETALSQRVKLWDESITPRLAEQNSRPEFDIHKYGGMMLKKFEKPQDTKLFEDAIESPNSWYICRLFAATLQLVNDNNFLISKDSDFQKSVNTMKLTLLSHHRLCERFDDYSSKS